MESIKKDHLVKDDLLGAHEKTRTSTFLRTLPPQGSASTNSATCARKTAANIESSGRTENYFEELFF